MSEHSLISSVPEAPRSSTTSGRGAPRGRPRRRTASRDPGPGGVASTPRSPCARLDGDACVVLGGLVAAVGDVPGPRRRGHRSPSGAPGAGSAAPSGSSVVSGVRRVTGSSDTWSVRLGTTRRAYPFERARPANTGSRQVAARRHSGVQGPQVGDDLGEVPRGPVPGCSRAPPSRRCPRVARRSSARSRPARRRRRSSRSARRRPVAAISSHRSARARRRSSGCELAVPVQLEHRRYAGVVP